MASPQSVSRTRKNEGANLTQKYSGYPELAKQYNALPDAFHKYGKLLGLNSIGFAVLAAIWRFQWDSRLPYPSYEQIADSCFASKKTAQNTIKDLEEQGFIIVERSARGSHKNNSYDLKPLCHALADLTAGEDHQEVRAWLKRDALARQQQPTSVDEVLPGEGLTEELAVPQFDDEDCPF